MGREYDSTRKFRSVCSPRLAIIACSESITWELPTRSISTLTTVKWLEECGKELFEWSEDARKAKKSNTLYYYANVKVKDYDITNLATKRLELNFNREEQVSVEEIDTEKETTSLNQLSSINV